MNSTVYALGIALGVAAASPALAANTKPRTLLAETVPWNERDVRTLSDANLLQEELALNDRCRDLNDIAACMRRDDVILPALFKRGSCLVHRFRGSNRAYPVNTDTPHI